MSSVKKPSVNVWIQKTLQALKNKQYKKAQQFVTEVLKIEPEHCECLQTTFLFSLMHFHLSYGPEQLSKLANASYILKIDYFECNVFCNGPWIGSRFNISINGEKFQEIVGNFGEKT